MATRNKLAAATGKGATPVNSAGKNHQDRDARGDSQGSACGQGRQLATSVAGWR